MSIGHEILLNGKMKEREKVPYYIPREREQVFVTRKRRFYRTLLEYEKLQWIDKLLLCYIFKTSFDVYKNLKITFLLQRSTFLVIPTEGDYNPELLNKALPFCRNDEV